MAISDHFLSLRGNCALSSACLWTGRGQPILLKKSGLVSAAEKYAPEIEIFAFGRGFQAQISRSSVQKRRFHWSMTRQFWMTDFFNRIGQKPSLRNASHRGNIGSLPVTYRKLKAMPRRRWVQAHLPGHHRHYAGDL